MGTCRFINFEPTIFKVGGALALRKFELAGTVEFYNWGPAILEVWAPGGRLPMRAAATVIRVYYTLAVNCCLGSTHPHASCMC